MATLQEVITSAGLPAERYIYTGKTKPKRYCTYQRVLGTTAVSADDTAQEQKETYRVTLMCKGDYEETLQKILEKLKAAGYYINSTDGESYETDTGYWVVPITIQLLKE
jgi:hypothetical protein